MGIEAAPVLSAVVVGDGLLARVVARALHESAVAYRWVARRAAPEGGAPLADGAHVAWFGRIDRAGQPLSPDLVDGDVRVLATTPRVVVLDIDGCQQPARHVAWTKPSADCRGPRHHTLDPGRDRWSAEEGCIHGLVIAGALGARYPLSHDPEASAAFREARRRILGWRRGASFSAWVLG